MWAIPAPRGGSRAFCDRMNSWAQGEGQPGLGYIFWRPSEGIQRGPEGTLDLTKDEERDLRDGIQNLLQQGRVIDAIRLLEGSKVGTIRDTSVGPIAKNLGAERADQLWVKLGSKLGIIPGDAVFFVAGEQQSFIKFAGAARTKIGEELGLINKDRFELCWIVDFPMYEWNEEEKKIDFSHNPFSMPNMPADEFLALDPTDSERILGLWAIQYDIVCNGVELSSGAIRNHRPEDDSLTLKNKLSAGLLRYC